jgi:hypothetical protein
VVERVVANTEGEIERVDLLPPFAYSREVSAKVGGSEGTSENSARIETGGCEATCSSEVLECDPSGKELEHLSSLNSLLIEFLQCIAFPQNAQFALLETSQQSV